MDELLHHCLRELSFDGDLGCNISRLRDFIAEFYVHSGTPQTPDDAFCAFVWSLVVQQPTVRVGTVPPGVTSEVWIAPQTSAKRKAKAKGQEHVETTPTVLDIVPNAKNRTLDSLRQEYGDSLRIAVDPDAIYAAITGSHIRFPKLSPMVYTALQIITRGRDDGITVVGLGQQSKYDQKTCFYLVRQLTELDLVVKVRRGGVGTHFCIHKYFFERSPSWKAIREEETQAEDLHVSQRHKADVQDEEEDATDVRSLNFSPIDARHLSSLPLIRARVVKLLKASRNQMHASNNLLITLGFSNPTKTDRRFFQSRIREMIQQGLIEKVVVPSNRKKSVNASVKCFRLVAADTNQAANEDGIVVQPQDGDDEEKDDGVGEQCGIKMNLTIHKQISNLLEESDMVGMTLNELSAALCQFDKRTIELFLTRAEKFPPPSHLADLGTAGLMETSGRERRHRYFTVASYRKLIAKEQLDKSTAGYNNVDLTNVGGFLPVDPDLFYNDQAALFEYQDTFKESEKAKSGRPRKYPLKNPVLPDGSVKQGRPRKHLGDGDGRSGKNINKRKRAEVVIDDLGVQAPELSEPGDSQPTKKRRVVPQISQEENESNTAPPPDTGKPSRTSNKGGMAAKKRGDLPKRKSVDEVNEEMLTQAPKKRARSSKVKPGATEERTETEGTLLTTITKKRARASILTGEDGGAHQSIDSTRGKRRRNHKENATAESLSKEGPTEDSPSLGTSHPEYVRVSEPDETPLLPSQVPDAPDSLTTKDEGGSGHRDIVSEGAEHQSTHASVFTPLEGGTDRSKPPTSQATNLLSTHLGHEAIEYDRSHDQHAIPIDPILLGHTQRIRNSPDLTSPRPNDKVISENPSHPPAPELAVPHTGGRTEAEDLNTESKSLRGSRVNVSHLRRENELYRVVKNMGGIVNIQTKEFYEEHMALLESMAKAGEATSAPVGTRTDKRTATSTFNNMERRGRIKQLKTVITTHTGIRRPACIVYLPSIEQIRLNDFLADLARGAHTSLPQPGNFVKIDEQVEYGADPTSTPRGALPLQLLQMEQPGNDRKERWSKNFARADQLFSYDDAVIRDVLLTERTTLGQLYGFIVGKAVRARKLHLSTLDAFANGNPSSYIISHDRRIVDLSFFGYDIPLGLYCSLVSSLSHDNELTMFLATDEGRQTLVRDIPPNLHTILQIGRSRARSRFLDILESLRALKLVTPLQPSTSDAPWITCTAAGDHPVAFDLAPLDGWTINTPMAAPVYWHFNDIAPLYILAVSEVAPPFWQDLPVTNVADGSAYWSLLQEACKKTDITTPGDSESITGPPNVGISVARSLRRTISWKSNYILTWHQMQYLKQYTEVSTGNTPLQDEDSGTARIQKISWVISAPEDTIRGFFGSIHTKLLRELEKARKRAENQTANKRAKRTAATKASLAKKAADARVQREKDWDALMLRLHPTTLEGPAFIRVRRVRSHFLQAGSTKDIHKWERQIVDALREADIAAKKVLNKRSFVARTIPVPLAVPPSTTTNPPEKPIDVLIAQQGPPIRQERVKRKRRGKGAEEIDQPETKAKALRRHRFQWNRDYEELARDASAIIRARCRDVPRLDWAAFEQVFPAVPRNTVRQRLAHIREAPGNEAYLSRLEDRWYDLWMQHRGTQLLPDDDPHSTNNFNLIKHIEFLRQHVDKNALRVGFAQPRESAGTIIPASPDELLDRYDVIETTSAVPSWDFMWNAIVEEGREKRLLRQPFTKNLEEMPATSESSSDNIFLAESAMKMTLGTPHERYDPERASALLHNVGEHYVSPATKKLINRGVLSKLVRDPQKQKPGRQLKISEVNQNAIGGSLHRDIFQDAVALDDISTQDDTWREWPLLATDGDIAALIQLVSDNKVEFKIDTTQAQLARPTLDWNSKKADDDHIETAIHIRFGNTPTMPLPQSAESTPGIAPIELINAHEPGHGRTTDGDIACCRRLSLSGQGLADCAGCLEDEWTSFIKPLDQEEREIATLSLAAVRQAGANGITKSDLKTIVDVTARQLFPMLRRMAEWPVPLLFWAGYSSTVLVSSAFLRNWTVLVSDSPVTRIFPRRWFDISGLKVVDFWEAALRAVISVIIFRPGISQAELRWRLRSVYDRQEVNEIIRFLHEEGFVNMQWDMSIERDGDDMTTALDESEEKRAFCFISDEKHWYQV